MKKKFYLIAMAILGVVSTSSAQASNPECGTNLSIFVEHAKVKNYDAAYTPWKMVYDNCPAYHWATFAYGERILADRVKKAADADKPAAINEMLKLYDDSRIHFPNKTSVAGVAVDKVLLKYANKMISDEEIYTQLDAAFKADAANFTNAKALYLYFSSLVDLNANGKQSIDQVFETYDAVTAQIETENDKLTSVVTKLLPKEEAGTLTSREKRDMKRASTNSEAFGQIQESIDSKLGNLANCENLIPLYEKNFEQKKNDVNWVKGAVGRMFSKECTDDPLFQKLFEAQLALDPSADAYMYGGSLKIKAGDTKGAIADFNKAVDLETDARKKSNLLYKIATIYRRGSKSTAKSYAQKAINANSSNGKAYLLIANLIAGSANDCGETTFEKRAIYWKAAEMARKAGRVDPSLSSRANQTASSYEAKAPSKTDIFNSGLAGKTVTFNCWVGGSVVVPNL